METEGIEASGQGERGLATATTMTIPFHRLYSTHVCQRVDSIIRNKSANMRAITSVLDTLEQTHVVGSLVDILVREEIGYCTAADQVEGDRLGLVRLDNQPVRAQSC